MEYGFDMLNHRTNPELVEGISFSNLLIFKLSSGNQLFQQPQRRQT